MFRFSLGALFLVVSFVALGCASLIYANDTWRQVVVTLAIVCVVTATIAAIVGRERGQPFAVGFAIIGWVYLILAFTPVLDVRDHLLTTRALIWLDKSTSGGMAVNNGNLYGNLFVDVDSDGAQDLVWSTGSTGRNTLGLYRIVSNPRRLLPENFLVIGHALWTIGLASLGGLLASFLSNHLNNHAR